MTGPGIEFVQVIGYGCGCESNQYPAVSVKEAA